MYNTISKIVVGTLLLISTLFAQPETVGAQYNYNLLDIDSLVTKSNVWTVNYRKNLLSGTRLSAAIGLSYLNFFENDTIKTPMLKSENQLFLQIGAMQKINVIYFKGAVRFYCIKGDVVEITGGYSKVLYNNTYRIFEFPLSAGLTFPIKDLDFSIGMNKTYFYGTNKKKLVVNNSGTKTNLGTTSRYTFKTELGWAVEATLLYHFYDKLDFELNLIKYQEEDFSVRLSVWGPLKRMLYIN